LLVLQAFNALVPLLLIPHLIGAAGVHAYGAVAFGLVLAQIACTVTDYGFNLSATHQVARASGDKAKIGALYGAVLVCKLILLAGVLLVLVAGIALENKYSDYKSYLWLTLFAVIGQTLQPIWLFQGIERMAFITIFGALSRCIFLGGAVVFVDSAQDLPIVAVANGLGHAAAASLGICLAWKLGYRPIRPTSALAAATFKESTQFFWARIAVSTYTSGGALLLGAFSTPIQLAYYSVADQLYRGGHAILAPIAQALYPRMARRPDYGLFSKILRSVLALGLLGIVVNLAIGQVVLVRLFGAELHGAYPVLVVFTLVFALAAPAVMLGYPFLGALGRADLANRSVIYAGVLQTGLLITLWLWGSPTAVMVGVSVLLVELFVVVQRAWHARRLSAALR